MLLGLGRTDPKDQGPVSVSRRRALDPAAAGGGDAQRAQAVLPPRQNTVERFFARPKEK